MYDKPNTPLSVCVAMSQAYIGYDLQNALREELSNRGITDIPVATMITQIRVDAEDPAFSKPSKPGRTALITLLEKSRDAIQGKTGTTFRLS